MKLASLAALLAALVPFAAGADGGWTFYPSTTGAAGPTGPTGPAGANYYEIEFATGPRAIQTGANVDCLPVNGTSTIASLACVGTGGAGFWYQNYRIWAPLTIRDLSCTAGEVTTVLVSGDEFDVALYTVDSAGGSLTLVAGTELNFSEPDFSATFAAFERATGLDVDTPSTGFLQVRWGTGTDPASSTVSLRCTVRYTD